MPRRHQPGPTLGVDATLLGSYHIHICTTARVCGCTGGVRGAGMQLPNPGRRGLTRSSVFAGTRAGHGAWRLRSMPAHTLLAEAHMLVHT